MTNKLTLAEHKKATEVLNSRHVGQVEASFDREEDGIRYYTAISHKGLIEHRYMVRAYEYDGNRWIKCQCAAGAKDDMCRHAIAVGKLDTKLTNREMYLPSLLPYKAHLATETKCSVCDNREAIKDGKCRQCAEEVTYMPNTSNHKPETLTAGGPRF